MSATEDRESRIAARIARLRAHRHRELHPLEAAMAGYFAEIDPKFAAGGRRAIEAIAQALAADGCWKASEEWRISTWTDSSIVKTERNGAARFVTSVECDRQKFTCDCPTIEKAYGFMRLYQRLIVDQFYSVGPPWADNRIFEP